MKKQFFFARSAARAAAENFAASIAGASIQEGGQPVADDKTRFDFEDDRAAALCWSGSLAGFTVQDGAGETVGVFAFWDPEE